MVFIFFTEKNGLFHRLQIEHIDLKFNTKVSSFLSQVDEVALGKG